MHGKVNDAVLCFRELYSLMPVQQTPTAAVRSPPGLSLSFQAIMGSSVDQIAAVVGADMAGKVTCESVTELSGHAMA